MPTDVCTHSLPNYTAQALSVSRPTWFLLLQNLNRLKMISDGCAECWTLLGINLQNVKQIHSINISCLDQSFTSSVQSNPTSPKAQTRRYFNFLSNDKILDRSKLKAFADNKKDVTEKLKFVLERVENIV